MVANENKLEKNSTKLENMGINGICCLFAGERILDIFNDLDELMADIGKILNEYKYLENPEKKVKVMGGNTKPTQFYRNSYFYCLRFVKVLRKIFNKIEYFGVAQKELNSNMDEGIDKCMLVLSSFHYDLEALLIYPDSNKYVLESDFKTLKRLIKELGDITANLREIFDSCNYFVLYGDTDTLNELKTIDGFDPYGINNGICYVNKELVY